MDKAVVAQKSPFAVEITAGVTYYWCRCGRSAKQPWCDGSHKDTGFTPVSFVADDDKAQAYKVLSLERDMGIFGAGTYVRAQLQFTRLPVPEDKDAGRPNG